MTLHLETTSRHTFEYIHLYSSETLIAINNGNKFKQQKKALEKNYVPLVP